MSASAGAQHWVSDPTPVVGKRRREIARLWVYTTSDGVGSGVADPDARVMKMPDGGSRPAVKRPTRHDHGRRSRHRRPGQPDM